MIVSALITISKLFENDLSVRVMFEQNRLI